MTEQDKKYLKITFENSKKVAESGNQPFASILVNKNGEIVATGDNQIASQSDPTWHSETALIRQFCHDNKILDLSEYTLYTNCEPCVMCAAAMSWAKLGRMVYAVSTPTINTMWDTKIMMTSKEVFATATNKPVVEGPVLEEEAKPIFVKYFKEHPEN